MRFKVFGALAIVISMTSCHKVPISERNQMNLLPESDLIGMSNTQYSEFLSTAKVLETSYSEQAQLVSKVGKKISDAVTTYMNSNGYSSRIKGFNWEFKLVEDPLVNAWCMPGGKVCVYTGILPITEDENGLAVVLGHEVAHAIARHGNERMSQAMMLQMGGMALSVAISEKSAQTQDLFMQAYGVGAQAGIMLPFSRKNELESDKLGLVFMELAGYDAKQAPEFWTRMSKNGENPPEFLSTHPSDETRMSEINTFLASESFLKHTGKL